MIAIPELQRLVTDALPDAHVEVTDWSHFGTQDHFNLTVSSRAFAGKTLIEQHQLIYKALDGALKDGRVHAVQIKTIIPEE